MPFKIVRNDITKMRCDAIVNTANTKPIIGSGCDYAVYKAAGKRRLSEYRDAQRQMREAVAIKANIDHLLGITDERENKAQER